MDGEDQRRPSRAVRFSATMRDLDAGVRILRRWLAYLLALVTMWGYAVPSVLKLLL